MSLEAAYTNAVAATALRQLGHFRATESSCFEKYAMVSDLVPALGLEIPGGYSWFLMNVQGKGFV